jgi:hypothetical protein
MRHLRFYSSHRLAPRCKAASPPQFHKFVVGLVGLTLFLVLSALQAPLFAQPQIPTGRVDNARGNANTQETLLTPANVNKNSFGRLFSVPVDYVVMAQPLYMPNVNIPGQGAHNVVYVVTQADSVYAIDADTGEQLWYASELYGGTTASGNYLPCGTGPGFNQEGIVSTPAIDPTTNTMYLVAKTVLNGTVRHHLHAIDISTGFDLPGSPVLIQAQSVSNKGTVTNFNSLHEKNRPGLLLLNGVVYIGFGSNSCNDNDTGWVLSYRASSLTQLGVFNTSPDYGLTSVWQSGVGLAADEQGNILIETAEAGIHGFDVPSGGQTYCNSVVKLAPDLTLADYFTPYDVGFLNTNDLDLSSTGALILPDQPEPTPHMVVASGKQGFVYVLNGDQLGMYEVNDSGVIQEFALIPGETQGTVKDVQFGSPAYWNNTVYFAPNGSPILAYPISGGMLGNPPGTPQRTVASYNGSHSPSISANGNTNGILWVLTGQLLAFDAVSLELLYSTTQAPNGRDKLPAIGHFVTQTVANGRVYVATNASLEVYGIFHIAEVTGGNGQTGTTGTTLPTPIQINVENPYNEEKDQGVTVKFSDGGKGGVFSPASAITDSNGNVSTTYTLPKKAGTYTLTASGTGFSTATLSETATAGDAFKIIAYGGAKQTGAAGSILPKALVAQAQDLYKNGVSGITITFTANKGAIPNPASVVTDANGMARTMLQLPTTVGTITVTGSAMGSKNISYVEYSVAGPAATISVTGGNNQTGNAGTQLPTALAILVTDQYGNPVSGNSVTFSDGGAGGTFSSPNPVITGTSGTASVMYTLPASPKTVTIDATATGVTNPAVFNETGQ